MSVMLGVAFEVGQAAVLFSILTSRKDRSRAMPWILMGVLTLVQILGNVFSSYAYLMTNSVSNLHYFTESILWWTGLSEDITTKIVTYIVGAILPVIALCMTAMITNYLNDEDATLDEPVDELDVVKRNRENTIGQHSEKPVESHVEEQNNTFDEIPVAKNENPEKENSHFINL